MSVKTKEIAEAAIFHLNGLPLSNYLEKHWHFEDPNSKAKELKLALINKQIKVEPLEFLEAVRRVKSFSNERKQI